jgi:hypothetical protein
MIYPWPGAPAIFSDRRPDGPHVVSVSILARENYLPLLAIEVRISLIGCLLSGTSYADPMQQIIAVRLVSYGKYHVPAIRRMNWAEYVARMEEMRGVYKVLAGKPDGKRPVGKTQA